jgi:hypothetical protein
MPQSKAEKTLEIKERLQMFLHLPPSNKGTVRLEPETSRIQDLSFCY